MTDFTIIAAIARNGVIGRNNSLPWRLPADLKHFKATTMGAPLIMGRKTFESFGGRLLPDRPHIVISRSPPPMSHDDLYWVNNIAHAMAAATGITSGTAYVIGGATIYQEFMNGIADQMILTHIEEDFEGDTVFPDIDDRQWEFDSDITEDLESSPPYRIRKYRHV